MNNRFLGLPGKYERPYVCKLYSTADQTLATATVTPINFNSHILDPHNMHNSSINNTRITISTRGLYFILGRVRFVFNATGQRETEIYLNGTDDVAKIIGINNQAANNPGLTTVTAVCTRELFPGDYIELAGYQSSGGNLVTQGGNAYQNALEVCMLQRT